MHTASPGPLAPPIDARSLRVVRGGRALLDGVDLSVGPGELVVVVGPNGAGKSTLVRTILGLIQADEGDILIFGESLRALSGAARAERLAWLPQVRSLAEPVAVVEQVMAARFRIRESRAERYAAAMHALDRVGLADLAERNATSLSGGESQRVGLAGLIAQQARAWLLDEPANHLDPMVQQRVLDTVLDEWRRGRPVLMVTHDPDRVLSRVHSGSARVVGLSGGQGHFECPADDPGLADALSDLYGVPMVSVEVDGARRLLFRTTP